MYDILRNDFRPLITICLARSDRHTESVVGVIRGRVRILTRLYLWDVLTQPTLRSPIGHMSASRPAPKHTNHIITYLRHRCYRMVCLKVICPKGEPHRNRSHKHS